MPVEQARSLVAALVAKRESLRAELSRLRKRAADCDRVSTWDLVRVCRAPLTSSAQVTQEQHFQRIYETHQDVAMVDDAREDAKLHAAMNDLVAKLTTSLAEHRKQTTRCLAAVPLLADQILVLEQHEAALSTAIAVKQAAVTRLPIDPTQ
jgi:ABC-type phosphonate transport system ATPase subunit